MAAPGPPRPILLTGASRGLGLEFARQWLAAGDRVFALARDPEASRGLRDLTTRHPGALVACRCDVADDASVAAARRQIEEQTDRLDLVLNNAGISGPRESELSTLDLAEVRRVLEVNTLGPLRVTRAFLPLLRRGKRPKLVHITSLMGSLADNRSGSALAYRMSKAALNMASRNLALELASDGILSVVLHPGWVKTDMGGSRAPLPVEEAVAALIRTIDLLTLKHNGGFFDREGHPAPW
jgi:NAD(P)-dependent dehydrogenase (short-subunit alcohol dehydrogenase family)